MAGFRKQFRIEAFDGGLNSKYEPQIIAPNESPDCLNVVYDDLGAAQTRYGYTQLNTSAVGSFSGEGLFTHDWNNGNQSMAGWWNGSMFTLSGTTFNTVPSAQSVFTAGQVVNRAQYQNVAFYGAGSNYPYKYTSDEVFTRHGVYGPTAGQSFTATGTSAGTLSGTYSYQMTFVNSFSVESDVSSFTATATVTAGNGTVGLTSLPTAPQSWGVSSRRLYRTEESDTTFKFLAEISDNSTTTYADNSDDTELGSNAPTDNGVPPNWKFCVTFKERLFCNDEDNPQYLWYSDLAEPYTFASTNFIKISDGDGEKITGLSVQNDTLVVCKESSDYLIYMPDATPSNWQIIKVDSAYGAVSHKSIVKVENYVMFLGQNRGKITGFYGISGAALDSGGTQLLVSNVLSDSKSDTIEPDVFSFNTGAKNLAAAILYENKVWVAVAKDSATANNYIYQFDFARRAESRRIGSWVPFTGIAAADFTIYDGKLYFQSSDDDGLVHQLEDGTYTDNGSAIDSYFWTKEFDDIPADIDFEKDYRQANFVVGALGAWDISVNYKTDSDIGDGDRELVDLTPGGSVWGAMTWGVDDWGGGVTRKNVKLDLGTKVGKRVQFKFSNLNTASVGFKVVRGNFYYNRRGLR